MLTKDQNQVKIQNRGQMIRKTHQEAYHPGARLIIVNVCMQHSCGTWWLHTGELGMGNLDGIPIQDDIPKRKWVGNTYYSQL